MRFSTDDRTFLESVRDKSGDTRQPWVRPQRSKDELFALMAEMLRAYAGRTHIPTDRARLYMAWYTIEDQVAMHEEIK
jgi:hypothetical protein